MRNKTLHQLYAEHLGKVSDKWSLYLTEYDRLFDSYRDKPISLLEIGVQNGGSLEIWSKYFPHARALIGCDINPDCASLRYDDPRIHVIVGDANALAVSEQVFSCSAQFDIIIDDGSHRSGDIVKSFAMYFPQLTDGGIFVAEDLHCSYWENFDGGLFDPYASMTFFKHLADVVNHEHWGVPKARADILQGILTKYRCKLDVSLLAQIHSVEFINSLCVLRKAPSEANGLGCRIIAGSIEQVVQGHHALNGQAYSLNAEAEINNSWSARAIPPGEALNYMELELANVKQALAERDAQVDVLYNSTAWRMTSPLRLLADKLKAAKRTALLARKAIKQPGTLKKAVQSYQRDGLHGVVRGLRKALLASQHMPASGSGGYDRNDYIEWVRRYDTLTDESRATIHTLAGNFVQQPLISVLMPVYNPNPAWLIEAIESIQQQLYPHWELCIADDASTNPAIRPILERYAWQDARIKVVFREENGHISAASNSALALVTGKWVALLDHDDILAEHALFWVAKAVNDYPDARLMYSDEDKIDEHGVRHGPYFKCDWNVDLFYSHNMFSHLGVYSTEILHDIGGFRLGMEGSQDYDLALRCIEHLKPSQIHHIPRMLYHWRVHAESTAQSSNAKPYAMLAGERALNEHFQRQHISATAKLMIYGYRVSYVLPSVPPKVSLIIPTRNGLRLIRQCIGSILKKTTYPNYEILIIDNGSDDTGTLEYLNSLQSEPRITVVRDDRPFNYSEINNSAVKLAKGELIGLLNNDLEVISPGWLSEMVSIALQPQVGAVGARLWYPSNLLQHGGVILGLGASGIAGHSHYKMPKGSHGYLGRGTLIQSLSAVTAACLVIRKPIYEEVGGLNEVNLQVAFNDIDFCLRLQELGYRNVWTPYAELYHHESASRGSDRTAQKSERFAKEASYMQQRWGDRLLNDPAYSPNLTLEYEDFSLAWPPRIDMFPALSLPAS